MRFSKNLDLTLYWGDTPLPDGAEAIGTVTGTENGSGVLLRLEGKYFQGIAGALFGVDPVEAERLISASTAAALLGSIRSPVKASRSKENGKRGGRPKLRVAEIRGVEISSSRPFIVFSSCRGLISEHRTLSAALKAVSKNQKRNCGTKQDVTAYSFLGSEGWVKAGIPPMNNDRQEVEKRFSEAWRGKSKGD